MKEPIIPFERIESPEFPLDYFKTAKTTGESILDEDLVEWMTEPTNPNMAPRSDNG